MGERVGERLKERLKERLREKAGGRERGRVGHFAVLCSTSSLEHAREVEGRGAGRPRIADGDKDGDLVGEGRSRVRT